MHATKLGTKRFALLLLVLAITSIALNAQVYTKLYDLGTNQGDPINPAWIGQFAQGRDGNLYSTTQGGGKNSTAYGAIFRLTPSGAMTLLYSFKNGDDGVFPNSGLTLGTDGSLYGTTPVGGSIGYGTIFKITTAGTFTTLHAFNGNTEGVQANAAPIQGPDGNFYGSTGNGGTITGTIYKMTPSGALTVIYTFSGPLRYPNALVLGTDGNFYGTAGGGSANPNGAVFKVTAQGKLTILHSFNGDDGRSPLGALIQASDGNFYGTTRGGGPDGLGVIYKISAGGTFSVIHQFHETDGFGYSPFSGMVQATDGKFYGTTIGPGGGLIYQVTTDGTYTIMHQFTGKDGQTPQVAPFQHTGGTLYGDTDGGGLGNQGCITCGVLYSLDMGLGPFVSIVNWMGKVGQTIEVLGQGLTGTTKVTFNGKTATFQVVSDTFLTAVLPAGATTGLVKVTTPGGTRTSNRKFLVIPSIASFNPTSGPVGTSVTITGQSFTQAQGVGFGDTVPAQFHVDSDTQITAVVPQGAKTGPVGVKTPGGTAISKDTFTVTQ